MSILEIPTSSDDAAYTQTVSLEGIFYLLRIFWNTRDVSWYLDMSLTDATPIIVGKKLVIDHEIINRHKIPQQPPGALFLVDTGLSKETCGRTDLGDRCKLIYLTSDEL